MTPNSPPAEPPDTRTKDQPGAVRVRKRRSPDRRGPEIGLPEGAEGEATSEEMISSWRRWFRWQRKRLRLAILFWLVMVLIVVLGLGLGLDSHLVAAAVLLWGILTHILGAALAFVLSLAGGVPFLGPLIVKAITLPMVFLVNGVAFLASLLGFKMGYKRRVMESRIAATLLTLGILIGYILGKLF